MILQPFFLRMFGNPITRQIKSTATVGAITSITIVVTASKIWIQRIYNGVSIITSYEDLVETSITLDIDANTNLQIFGKYSFINCELNQLTELDLSANVALTSVRVGENPFMSDSTEATNFGTNLPTVTSGILYLSTEDSEAATVKTLAEAKGWTVTIS